MTVFDKDDDSFDALATEAKNYLSRFLHMPSEAAMDTLVLWAFHTHATGKDGTSVFAYTPRLALLSDLPASGKTMAMELCLSLCRNPEQLVDPSAPGVLGLINEKQSPTIALDELDLLLSRDNNRPLRSILNSGFKPGATVMRYGREMSTFSPVIMAGLASNFVSNENLRATKSRSICVFMQQLPDDIELESYRERLHEPLAIQMNRAIAHWGRVNASELACAYPDLPQGVKGRTADIWEPLIATGDAIGPEWSERARKACETLALAAIPSDIKPESPMERLARDLSSINLDDTIATADLLTALSKVNSYWDNFPNPRSAAMELSALLRPLDVSPVKLWKDNRAIQGYRREAFEAIPGFSVTELTESFNEAESDDPNLLPL